jgi:hypothetical protein
MLLLIRFHKHSFTPYPSLSGQVGISSIHSKDTDRKLPIFLGNTLLLFHSLNTLLLHIPLLALTERRTERQTEEQIHLLHVGWRNFFSSCAVVSIFGSGGK